MFSIKEHESIRETIIKLHKERGSYDWSYYTIDIDKRYSSIQEDIYRELLDLNLTKESSKHKITLLTPEGIKFTTFDNQRSKENKKEIAEKAKDTKAIFDNKWKIIALCFAAASPIIAALALYTNHSKDLQIKELKLQIEKQQAKPKIYHSNDTTLKKEKK